MASGQAPIRRTAALVASLFILTVTSGPLSTPVQAAGTTDTPVVTIDTPRAGLAIVTGQPIRVDGWAADPAAAGTGVDRVDVYLDGEAQGSHIGVATYGLDRPDVAAAYGRPEWTRSGFSFEWTPVTLTEGSHTIYVQARARTGAVATESVSMAVAGTPGPLAGMRGNGPDGPPRYGGRDAAGYARGYPPANNGRYGYSSGYYGGYGAYPVYGGVYGDPYYRHHHYKFRYGYGSGR